MSTLSIKSRNTKSAAPKKGSVQSKTASRRKVTSPAANAKKPTRSVESKAERVAAAKTPVKIDQPQVERVTKQERVLTLLSQSEGASIRGSVTPAPPISLKSGTRLVREWRGVTHTVLIHADGNRMARSALPFPLRGRTGDHRRPLVGPAVLRPQAAAAGLYLKRESGRWRGLITSEPG